MAAQLEEGEGTKADLFFSQDAGALGALAKAGRLQALPDATTSKVQEGFADPAGLWVATSARARVIAYDPAQAPEATSMTTVDAVLDPKYKGKVGFVPTNASFQSFVTALRVSKGEAGAKAWLEAFKANEPKAYDNNILVLDAVDSGQVALGLVNHYYWYERVAEKGADAVNAKIHFLDANDPGALINVAGAGVLAGSQSEAATKAADFLPLRRGAAVLRRRDRRVPGRRRHHVDQARPRAAGRPQGAGDRPQRPELLEETLAMLDEVGLTLSTLTPPTARDATTAARASARRRDPAPPVVPVRTVGGGRPHRPHPDRLPRGARRRGRAGPDRRHPRAPAHDGALVGRSLLLVTLVTALSVAIGVGLAFAARTDVPGRRVLAALARSRWRSPAMSRPLPGSRPCPQIAGLTGAVLVLTLCCYPYVYLPVLAALRRADPGLEEVARALGRTPWQTFREVTLRQVRPSAAAGGLLVALYTLSDFGAVSILRYDVFTRVIYTAYRSSFDRSTAAVLSLLLVALTVAISVGSHGFAAATSPASGPGSPASQSRCGSDPCACRWQVGPGSSSCWRSVSRSRRCSTGSPPGSRPVWMPGGWVPGSRRPRGCRCSGPWPARWVPCPPGILAARHRGRFTTGSSNR